MSGNIPYFMPYLWLLSSGSAYTVLHLSMYHIRVYGRKEKPQKPHSTELS